MKRALLKLVSVVEIISGLAGLCAVAAGVIGITSSDFVPILWYGIFPLASVVAGVLLFRLSKFGLWLSVVIQLLQVPLFMTERVVLNLGAVMKLSISGIWCVGDCRVRLLLGINFLALAILIILLSCQSGVQVSSIEPEGKVSV